jgi:hypothetical protein
MEALGEKPILSEAQLKRYGYGSEPVCADDEDIFFLYSHETYHAGQTEVLRQLAGKDDKA